MNQAEILLNENEPAPQKQNQQPILSRIRLVFARHEALRYTSHLDFHLVWERTLRRAEVPLAYSQGFNPHPRLHVASALPLGFISRCEIADFWLNQAEEETTNRLDLLVAEIQKAAPPGLEILSGQVVPLSLPALQTQVQFAEYIATALDPLEPASLSEAAGQIIESETLQRERRGKAYDLRPLIETLEVQQDDLGKPRLFMRLAARESATGRPEEVLAAMGFDPAAFRVERTALRLA